MQDNELVADAQIAEAPTETPPAHRFRIRAMARIRRIGGRQSCIRTL
jgi:hypothetical protein